MIMNKKEKPSSDVFTRSELRTCFLKRAKTTTFSSSRDKICVSFKFFSNIASIDKSFSAKFYQMISEAMDNVKIFTDRGTMRLHQIDHAFVDANGFAVMVLPNGDEAIVLKENPATETTTPMIVDSIEKLELSTRELKEYVLDNLQQFSYLSKLTELLKTVNVEDDERKTKICALAMRCREMDGKNINFFDCLKEMQNLFRNASFVVGKRR